MHRTRGLFVILADCSRKNYSPKTGSVTPKLSAIMQKLNARDTNHCLSFVLFLPSHRNADSAQFRTDNPDRTPPESVIARGDPVNATGSGGHPSGTGGASTANTQSFILLDVVWTQKTQ